MGAGLYDAAFSTLGSIYGKDSRASITHVTLFGGFASTVCWPLSALLVEQLGWRGACAVYAAIQLLVSLPIYVFALPRRQIAATETEVEAPGRPLGPERSSSLRAARLCRHHRCRHSGDHRHASASACCRRAASISRSRWPWHARRTEPGRRSLHRDVRGTPLPSGLDHGGVGHIGAVSAAMLFVGFPIVALAIILYGAGNGIGSVARGTVPLAVFGPERYPVLMGRLALPLLIADGDLAVPWRRCFPGRRRGLDAGAAHGACVDQCSACHRAEAFAASQGA